MERIIVTEPTFFPLKPSEKGLIGISSVVFNNALSLNSISVYIRPNGDIRLLFPDKTLFNGRKVNVYYPISKTAYEAIKSAVEAKYREIAGDIKHT